MIVFACLKKDFIKYVEEGIISNKVYDAYKDKLGKKTKLSQIKSWSNSLPFMKNIIKDLPDDVGITIEYRIPLTSKMIDMVISGYDIEHKPIIILVELKQWEYVKGVIGEDAVIKTLIGKKEKRVLHPSYQVLTYKNILNNYNINVEEYKINVIPIVYLHNYDINFNDLILAKKFKTYYQKAKVYGKKDWMLLKEFIDDTIKFGDNLDIINIIDNSEVRPTKKLTEAIVNMIEAKKEFVLLDEQKVIAEHIYRIAHDSYIDNKKRVIIIKGGPGTGKSILALNALGELLANGLMGAYVSKNMAPRKVYKNLLINNNEVNINELFKSSGNFFRTKTDKFDFLLIDEAHRLQEKSGLHNNLGENQIKEIINASRLSVFLIDEKQKVTLNDIGTIANIKSFAKENKALIYEYELISQFRCNGSNNYLDFIDNFLYNKRGTNNFDFDFKVMDNPKELRELIIKKNTSNNARLVAGFCWTRNGINSDNQNFHDIKIDDFEMSWNLKHGEPFATRKNAINEIGCIHNVQGLEFDYIGVIIGPDLKYKNRKVITDYNERAYTEKSLYGIKTLIKKDKEYYENLADTIIRNTYRVLLTRGIKGCYIYACDKNLQKHLKKIVDNNTIKIES
ncbi:MAG: DUF2075 domain-containing protein [Ruminococcus sp.]|nr:DUF2075 domain-containing protein [Ruminococcus sp.]